LQGTQAVDAELMVKPTAAANEAAANNKSSTVVINTTPFTTSFTAGYKADNTTCSHTMADITRSASGNTSGSSGTDVAASFIVGKAALNNDECQTSAMTIQRFNRHNNNQQLCETIPMM
jgi:hypothetical protein